jgi:hypothetical protein
MTRSEWVKIKYDVVRLKYDVVRLKAIVFGQSIGMAVLAVIVAVRCG